jgi:hypothetical protein
MPAANPLYEVLPRHVSFAIGRDSARKKALLLDDPLVGIVKREGVLEVIDPAAQDNPPVNIVLLCQVTNYGNLPFTLQCEQSSNNESAGVGGTLATAATGSAAFSGQPADTDTVVISDGVTSVTFEFEQAAPATGTLTFSGGLPSDGETVTIDDGVNPATVFEFDTVAPAIGELILAGQPDEGDTFRVSDGTVVADFEFDTGAIASTGTLVLGGQPDDADEWILDDGVNPAVTFEFDDNASVVETSTLRQVVIGLTVADTLDNLQAAVNAAPALDITADAPTGGDTVPLTNDAAGTAGDVAIVENVNVSTNLSSTGMAGGADAVVETPTLRAVLIGATLNDTLTNLLNAINSGAFTFGVTASNVQADRIDLTNDAIGTAGNVAIAEPVNVSTNLSSTGMAGGDDLDAGANQAVEIGVDEEATRDNFLTALLAVGGGIAITGSPSGTDTINLVNNSTGTAGNVPIVDAATNVAVTGMSGGTGAGLSPGSIGVDIGATTESTVENLRQAVNTHPFDVTALSGSGTTALLANTIGNGAVGNVALTGVDSAVVQTLTGMSGGVGLPYFDVPIRLDGSSIADGEVVVVPGGRAVFLIEWFSTVENYLRFSVADPGAFGELTLAHYNGTLTTREREGNP